MVDGPDALRRMLSERSAEHEINPINTESGSSLAGVVAETVREARRRTRRAEVHRRPSRVLLPHHASVHRR